MEAAIKIAMMMALTAGGDCTCGPDCDCRGACACRKGVAERVPVRRTTVGPCSPWCECGCNSGEPCDCNSPTRTASRGGETKTHNSLTTGSKSIRIGEKNVALFRTSPVPQAAPVVYLNRVSASYHRMPQVTAQPVARNVPIPQSGTQPAYFRPAARAVPVCVGGG